MTGRCAYSRHTIAVERPLYGHSVTAVPPHSGRSGDTATQPPPWSHRVANLRRLSVRCTSWRAWCGRCADGYVAAQRRIRRHVSATPPPLSSRSTAVQWRMCGDTAPRWHLLRGGGCTTEVQKERTRTLPEAECGFCVRWWRAVMRSPRCPRGEAARQAASWPRVRILR